jgi:hypothetical protein
VPISNHLSQQRHSAQTVSAGDPEVPARGCVLRGLDVMALGVRIAGCEWRGLFFDRAIDRTVGTVPYSLRKPATLTQHGLEHKGSAYTVSTIP